MNLKERISHSKFFNERHTVSKKRIILESVALGAFSLFFVDKLDKDFSNSIMYLPDFLHGHMHDFMGGAFDASFARIMTRTRGGNMGYGASLSVSSELLQLTDISLFKGTFDPGDIFAFLIGTAAWGTVNYLGARGMDRFRSLGKFSRSSRPTFSS